MDGQARYLLDGESEVNVIYLADDAVRDFLEEGPAYEAAYRSDELGLGPFYSQDTFDRIDEKDLDISFRELRKLGNGYEERPVKRPEWYEGEKHWLDQVEIAKFPGSQDSDVLMMTENGDMEGLVDRKDYMMSMSPEEVVEALNP
ncbi:MAG: hypothetical protein ABEK04_01465 [Candidatus Nanohalobium sp.]